MKSGTFQVSRWDECFFFCLTHFSQSIHQQRLFWIPIMLHHDPLKQVKVTMLKYISKNYQGSWSSKVLLIYTCTCIRDNIHVNKTRFIHIVATSPTKYQVQSDTMKCTWLAFHLEVSYTLRILYSVITYLFMIMKKATAIPIITDISNTIMKMNDIPETVIQMNI